MTKQQIRANHRARVLARIERQGRARSGRFGLKVYNRVGR